jgi:hypothetical protein
MRFEIEQAEFMPILARFGELGYIEQGEMLVVLEPEQALQLSDALVAWAASKQVQLSKSDAH